MTVAELIAKLQKFEPTAKVSLIANFMQDAELWVIDSQDKVTIVMTDDDNA